ncbi:MAG: 30S ribosomal protein S6 [Phycisphaerae bacterium]|nr:30S ribosomal protein S6 [Phycisphaerae bacterium]
MATPKRVYQYEAMFLLSQAVAADLGSAVEHIKEIIARGHGEIVALRKWDERRLAYEIAGQKRGIYILVYFKAPNTDLAHIERDCNLSEKIMRTLIVRADQYTPEEIASFDGRKELEVEIKLRGERAAQAATEGSVPAAPAAPAAPEPAAP